ncbi:MAG: hypothetical protein J0L92_40245 [Deltaproteobacteria bacterium]|nr:hypothetical protein [Deltaproteobacteria bacterium]
MSSADAKSAAAGRARIAVVGCALALAACSQTAVTATVRTFNRPVQTAFVCLETATGNARNKSDCTPDSSGAVASGLAMHALVLQEARGEVASVDLVARTVIDSDPAVPGYSFVPVDPLPTAIVVPSVLPTCAFVSSAGADAIDAIDVHLFRRESAATAMQIEPLALPGAPTAMVLDPSETALWVAIPERSSVARIEIDGCTFGAIEEIVLEPTVPPGLVAPSFDDRTTARYCPADFAAAPLPTLVAREPELLDVAARPSVLAVGRELLIGDRALPLVHRVDFSARVPLTPFSIGATVRALAVTPEVPDSYNPSSTDRSRYVYAIDDEDGTVLALDYADPASPTFGAVLPIGPSSSVRPDRIPFLAGARTLEVAAPLYDELEPFAQLCDPASISDDAVAPSHVSLRGVFLVVGLTDATVRFVDVFDSDAPCRGRVEGDPEDCTDTAETFVYVRRHHPRLGQRLTSIGVTANDVSFLVNGATVRLTDSSEELSRIPCAAPLTGIFASGTDGTARVCGHSDPFEAVSEVWQAAWQGTVTGTASSTGNLEVIDASTIALDSRVDFCAAGVLGSEDAAAAPLPESALGGDVIAITSTLSEAMGENERCQAVVGIEGSNQSARPVLVPIRAASTRPDGLREPYRGRLLLDADAPVLDRATPGLTLTDVLACFGDELVRFDVRVRGAFSVTGSRSGQRHRVIRSDDGACVIDESLPTTRTSRARAGETFTNELISFRIASPPTSDSTELRVTIGTVPATLNLDVGVSNGVATRLLALPSDLVWNEVNQRLYVVDVERRGLIELTLQPLSYTTSTFQ